MLNLVEVDKHFVTIDPGGEEMQRFVVVVGRHPRIEAVVPAVYAADEILAGHVPIGELHAAVEAASVHH